MSGKDKSKCVGCRDDWYNGKNPLGIKSCRHLENAELVQRILVHRNQIPPYDRGFATVEVYDCRKEVDFCFVKPESLTLDGYWK